LLKISKSDDYHLLLEKFYIDSDTIIEYTNTIDNVEYLVENFIPDIIMCDARFGNVSIIQIKKIIDAIKPNIMIVALSDCFGDNNLDSLMDSGVSEFICYNGDLRLTDKRLKLLLGDVTKPVIDSSTDDVLTSDKEDIIINLTQNTLYQHGKPVHVTQLEFNLLVYFLQNKNTLLKRADIVEKIWHEDSDSEVNYRKVDSFVKKLRAKVDNLSSIKSVRGLGYRWEE
jgi:DNA-binding response OmpR family regulator